MDEEKKTNMNIFMLSFFKFLFSINFLFLFSVYVLASKPSIIPFEAEFLSTNKLSLAQMI